MDTATNDPEDYRSLSSTRRTGDSGGAFPGQIGPYRLLQLLGEGGMGEVWLAEQQTPIHRKVALKLIKTGMDSKAVVARFESERQALALMDHPNIARVFDAGSTAEGRPYLVMEYVPGPPITEYCDKRRCTMKERLELFVQVCEGVQHAHQKAIIHRDLKPSNVLVVEQANKAVPKIIDFGLAKAATQRLTDKTMFTQLGVMIGTLEYMSPEQADHREQNIDTRTDVYSLGVILYELLVGVLPFEVTSLRTGGLEEILRVIREQEPPKPSSRIRLMGIASTDSAEKRKEEPRSFARRLRGELDWITMKALDKDRTRRYGSPAELGADIERYLHNDPVLAHPPSPGYLATKFARRHRFGVVAVASAMVLLLGFAAAMAAQARRIATERDRANREAAVAEAVTGFLQNDVLAQASAATQSGPRVKPDPDLKVRTALDRAAARIAGKFDNEPEVEAAIRDTMGQTYLGLGLYPEARTQLERALSLHRGALGAENPKTIKTSNRLGNVARLQGKYIEAEALLDRALEIGLRVSGSEDPETLSSMSTLAIVYRFQGKSAQAEALASQSVDVRRRVLGPEHRETLNSVDLLAVVYFDRGKYVEAEALDNQTLEMRRRILGSEHPETLNSMSNLALVYRAQGKYAEAETLDSQTLEIRRRVLGRDHPDTLAAMNNLALIYLDQGKYREADVIFSQALEIQRRVLGPEHPETLNFMNNLAVAYIDQGKYVQAESLCTRTLEMKNRVLGPEHPSTLYTLSYVAFLYQREGKYALAESYAARELAGRRHTLGPEHTDTIAAAADLALAYQSQGKLTQSEPLAREAWEIDRKNRPDDWQRFRVESLLGASLSGQKKYAEAEPLLLEGYQGMVARKGRTKAENSYHLDRAREWIVQLYQASGKPEQAAKWGTQTSMH